MGYNDCSMFCYALLCGLSSFAIIMMGKRQLVGLLCFGWSALFVLVSCDCYVAHPHGTMDWSEVCDCGIS